MLTISEIYEKGPPIKDLLFTNSEQETSINFELLGLNVCIKLWVSDPTHDASLKQMLEFVYKEPDSLLIGYSITLDLGSTHITDDVAEYAVFIACNSLLDNVLSGLSWDYLYITGLDVENIKLHNGISQHLTKQPHVERYIQNNNTFLVART